jgi:hypothetical protein
MLDTLCSVVSKGNVSGEPCDVPLLYSVPLRKGTPSLLSYLPGDAFWAILARIETGKLRQIEAHYEKPPRGFADLASLHFT